MKIAFDKYHGAGNDFILLDGRDGSLHLSQEQVRFLCSHHYGICADGLMILLPAEGYDFGMRYFNSDGKESSMCGNGGRCMAVYARQLGIVRDRARFLAADGPHLAEILSSSGKISQVRLNMNDVTGIREVNDGFFLNTGSPHFVRSVVNADSIDVLKQGRAIRNDKQFVPGGTNVDFMEIRSDGLFVRSYERGVEDETLSCGTGVTASAIAFSRLLRSARFKRDDGSFNIPVSTRGGRLMVSFRQDGQDFLDVQLEGPAEFVFHGEIDL